MAGLMTVKMVGLVFMVGTGSRVGYVTVKLVDWIAENWIDDVVGSMSGC